VTALVLLAVALAVAIVVASRYRTAAAGLRRQLDAATAAQPRSPARPVLAASMTALPAAGPLAGEVTVFLSQPSRGMARIVLAAHITGGRPYTRYALVGNACLGSAGDHPWAAGVTDGHGSANLTGHPWAVSLAGEYWLWLSPSPRNPGPGLHGTFAAGGGLTAFPAGHPPCEPVPASGG
jgi:hypothetical protein